MVFVAVPLTFRSSGVTMPPVPNRARQDMSNRKKPKQPEERSPLTVWQKVSAWTKLHLLTARPIFTHLLVFLLGSGGVWQYWQVSIQRENQAQDIRKEMMGTQEKLLGIVNELGDISTSQNENERVRKTQYLKRKHELLLTALNEFETRLARLEDRMPRKMDYDFPPGPAAPTGLSVR